MNYLEISVIHIVMKVNKEKVKAKELKSKSTKIRYALSPKGRQEILARYGEIIEIGSIE